MQGLLTRAGKAVPRVLQHDGCRVPTQQQPTRRTLKGAPVMHWLVTQCRLVEAQSASVVQYCWAVASAASGSEKGGWMGVNRGSQTYCRRHAFVTSTHTTIAWHMRSCWCWAGAMQWTDRAQRC